MRVPPFSLVLFLVLFGCSALAGGGGGLAICMHAAGQHHLLNGSGKDDDCCHEPVVGSTPELHSACSECVDFMLDALLPEARSAPDNGSVTAPPAGATSRLSVLVPSQLPSTSARWLVGRDPPNCTAVGLTVFATIVWRV